MTVAQALILHLFIFHSAWAQDLPSKFKPELKNKLDQYDKKKNKLSKMKGLLSESVQLPSDIPYSERIKILLGISESERPPQKPPVNDESKDYNGGRGPGGGDGMLCVKSKHNRFDGFYSYTYIQTRRSLDNENKNEYDFSNRSCLGNLMTIQMKLAKKNPVLAAGLLDFIKTSPLNDKPEKSSLRTWKPFSEGQNLECAGRDIKDEHQLIDTPNCVKCQMFNRSYGETRANIIYNFDRVFFDQIKSDPLQCSYALIHEWARDFIKGTKEVYYFTAQLHSQDFHSNGEIDYENLDEKTAQCLKEFHQKPIDQNSLDIYFDIVSQVPPSMKDLEENRKQVIEKYEGLGLLLEQRLKKMTQAPLPIGMNLCQMSQLQAHVSKEFEEIKKNVEKEKMTYADAIAQLQVLVDGRYPGENIRSSEIVRMFMMCPIDAPAGKFE